MSAPKLTILEGPDGGGKTTLAKTAFRHAYYEHCGPPPLPASRTGWNPAFRQYLEVVLQAAMRPEDTVFDRLMYGELIYGPLLRGDSSFQWWHVRMLERVLLSYQGLVVFCLPEYKACLNTWNARRAEELVDNADTLEQIYAAYQGIILRNSLPHVVFDYETDGFIGADKFLANLDERRPPLNDGPGVGMFAPGVTLLVGEQINEKAAVNDHWPFVSGHGASRWLTQRLVESGVPETDLYWINAKRANGLWTSPGFVQRLLPKQIIAMGGVAKEWCQRYKLPHNEVPHPAYWSRFHASEPENYPLLEALSPPGSSNAALHV